MVERIQRKRTKGWRMPPNTVCVCRPGPFGNPFTAKAAEDAGYGNGPEMAVYGFIRWLAGDPLYKRADIDPGRDFILANVGGLRGQNLACWCPIDKPCHANVLLEMANGPPASSNELCCPGGCMFTPCKVSPAMSGGARE